MYFPLFKRHGWGKRLGEGRRHNGAMMPLIDGFIILKFSGFSTGNLSAIPQPRGMHQQAGGHTRPPLRQNRELVHWQELRYRWPAGRCGHRPLQFHHAPTGTRLCVIPGRGWWLRRRCPPAGPPPSGPGRRAWPSPGRWAAGPAPGWSS